MKPPTPHYDSRTLDSSGLPHLGPGEAFFHASFEVAGERNFVEGVVAASAGQEAVDLLLSAEANFRLVSRSSLLQRAKHALSRRLTRAEALELAPNVPHRVSQWKASDSLP